MSKNQQIISKNQQLFAEIIPSEEASLSGGHDSGGQSGRRGGQSGRRGGQSGRRGGQSGRRGGQSGRRGGQSSSSRSVTIIRISSSSSS